eukprot:m.35433 g.35433  ORF g.35433 m.35433 type:complete len:84 (-) comp10925_c0_seq1:80-331(-)
MFFPAAGCARLTATAYEFVRDPRVDLLGSWLRSDPPTARTPVSLTPVWSMFGFVCEVRWFKCGLLCRRLLRSNATFCSHNSSS